jgi:hypothetical protein
VGRWLSEDPTGLAGGDANLFRYCGNAPTDGTDPSGMAAAPDANFELRATEIPADTIAEANGRWQVTWRFELQNNAGHAAPLVVIQKIDYEVNAWACLPTGKDKGSHVKIGGSYFEVIGFIPPNETTVTLFGTGGIIDQINDRSKATENSAFATLPSNDQAQATIDKEIAAGTEQQDSLNTRLADSRAELQKNTVTIGNLNALLARQRTPNTVQRFLALQESNLALTRRISDLSGQIASQSERVTSLRTFKGLLGKNFTDFWGYPGFTGNPYETRGTFSEKGTLYVLQLSVSLAKALRNFKKETFTRRLSGDIADFNANPLPEGAANGGGLGTQQGFSVNNYNKLWQSPKERTISGTWKFGEHVRFNENK